MIVSKTSFKDVVHHQLHVGRSILGLSYRPQLWIVRSVFHELSQVKSPCVYATWVLHLLRCSRLNLF